MRPAAALRRLALPLVGLLALAAAAPLPASAEGARVRIDPGFPNPGYTGRGLAPAPAIPRQHGGVVPRRPATVVPQGPVIACDSYGRCWQHPGYGYGYGYRGDYGYAAPLGTRPPGWADDLPYRAQEPGRFARPRPGVVCDQASAVCYKRGEIDKTETRDYFGPRAADRADDLRDDRGTARLFVPERGVTCDPGRGVCYDDGVPDRSLTRRYFGQRAADALD